MRSIFQLPSSNFTIPYEYERSPLPDSWIDRHILVNVNKFINGRCFSCVTLKFFNQGHCDMVLGNWNNRGRSMARTPNPVDGLTMHWSYAEEKKGIAVLEYCI